MMRAARKTLADDTKTLMDLVGRNPTAGPGDDHVERLLAGWREALDLDACQERLDALRSGLAEGVEPRGSSVIEQMAEAAADMDPASKAEARNAVAAVKTMRTAHRVSMAGGMVPA